MADDCCGGGGPAWPIQPPTSWPCANDTGTTSPLAGIDTPSMLWEGMDDASTILHGEPAFSPPDNPALVTVVDVRNSPYRNYRGLPAGCFNTPANCHQNLDLSNPRNWRYHAQMLRYSYTDPPAQGKYLQRFLPCATRGFVVPNSDSDTPGTFMAYTDQFVLVYISGTTTFQQKALQGCYTLAGPIFGDGFGTLGFWNTNYRRLVDRFFDHGIPLRPNWFFAGHSYGAALASIFAGVVKRTDPTRRVILFTEGGPCPGDSRLQSMLANVEQVNLQNVGDPVCSMPPQGVDFWSIYSILLPALRLVWPDWRPNRNRVNVSPAGVITNVNSGSVEFTTLETITAIISGGGVVGDYAAHGSDAYLERCELID